MTTATESVKCRACGGKGSVPAMDNRSDEGLVATNYAVVCPDCSNSGYDIGDLILALAELEISAGAVNVMSVGDGQVVTEPQDTMVAKYPGLRTALHDVGPSCLDGCRSCLT